MNAALWKPACPQRPAEPSINSAYLEKNMIDFNQFSTKINKQVTLFYIPGLAWSFLS